MKRLIWLAFVILAGCQAHEEKPMAPSNGWTLSSTTLHENQEMPTQYTASDKNVSPPLSWSTPPVGTKTVALIVDDPDAPGMTPFVHWLEANIPPESSFEEGKIPSGAVAGKNGHGDAAYYGPKPPSGTHHYHFKVYALDTELKIQPGFDKATLETAMSSHVLAQTELVALSSAKN